MEKFVLVDGYVVLNNEQLFIKKKEFQNDLKSRGGWLGVFLSFLGISVYNNLKKEEYFIRIFDYIDFGLRILGIIAIIGIFIYLIFLRKSKKKLYINDIIRIEKTEKEFQTDVALVFSSKREYDLRF